MKKAIVLAVACFALTVLATQLTSALAASDAPKKKKKPWDEIVINQCPAGFDKPSPHCSPVVTPSFDTDGKLWLAWVNDGHVYVSPSNDAGRTLGAPVLVNPQAVAIDQNGENRPKVVAGPGGALYVSYTIKAKKKYTGDVLFSRSVDGGKSFAKPHSINDFDGATSLRFESLSIGRDGRVYLTWLDKRDLFAAKATKTPYSGSAIYYAVSADQGATWSENRMLAEHTCECCRIAIDTKADGLPVLVWRHIFDGSIRDHGVITFAEPDRADPMTRLSVDEWELDGCPHHGPSLSIDQNGVQHTTWFTSGEVRQGPFYARSTDGGKTFADLVAIGPDDDQAEHPFTLAHGGTVYTAWKAFGDDSSAYRLMTSADDGQTWSKPRTVMTTGDASDHPLLVASGSGIYASWWTAVEGWRLTPVMEN